MMRRVVSLVILAVAISSCARAQSTFGSMVGVAKDPAGSVVAGAQLVLTGLDDKSRHTANTDADGNFEFMNLKPGRYEVVVQAPGFADFKTTIQLEARQTVRIDAQLQVKGSSETVEVGDAAPMINTESATLADSKNFAEVSQLPVNYRGATTSSLAMVATVPG
ncbi:MAG TPA: carboxypeptidase-like regulatory domain-containing protein, partial [Terriglobales bacterium]|nr:carboxypeptidase-like regulatory domain-containing protein [Terriglobales bacterium]